jgi:hypothetical protein
MWTNGLPEYWTNAYLYEVLRKFLFVNVLASNAWLTTPGILLDTLGM